LCMWNCGQPSAPSSSPTGTSKPSTRSNNFTSYSWAT
jgi:hypothetical protein